jgi:hypothetical protein
MKVEGLTKGWWLAGEKLWCRGALRVSYLYLLRYLPSFVRCVGTCSPAWAMGGLLWATSVMQELARFTLPLPFSSARGNVNFAALLGAAESRAFLIMATQKQTSEYCNDVIWKRQNREALHVSIYARCYLAIY